MRVRLAAAVSAVGLVIIAGCSNGQSDVAAPTSTTTTASSTALPQRTALWNLADDGEASVVEGVTDLASLIAANSHESIGLDYGGTPFLIDDRKDPATVKQLPAAGIDKLTVTTECPRAELSTMTECWWGLSAGRVIRGDLFTPYEVHESPAGITYTDIIDVAGSATLWLLRKDGTVWAADGLSSEAAIRTLDRPVPTQGLVDVARLWGSGGDLAIAETESGALYALTTEGFTPTATQIQAPPDVTIQSMTSTGFAVDTQGNLWAWPASDNRSNVEGSPSRLVGPQGVAGVFPSRIGLFGRDHTVWSGEVDDGKWSLTDISDEVIGRLPDLAEGDVLSASNGLILLGYS